MKRLLYLPLSLACLALGACQSTSSSSQAYFPQAICFSTAKEAKAAGYALLQQQFFNKVRFSLDNQFNKGVAGLGLSWDNISHPEQYCDQGQAPLLITYHPASGQKHFAADELASVTRQVAQMLVKEAHVHS